MVIAVDCDEVLFPFVGPFCRFLNQKYGLRLKKMDLRNYALWKSYGVTQEQYTEDIHEFERTDDYRKIVPFAGAVPGIKKLRQLDELVILTSRSVSLGNHTGESIEKYFGESFSRILFSGHPLFNPDGTPKRVICRKENARLLIEDSGEIAADVSTDIPVILFNKHYNRGFSGGNIFRAEGWKEINKIAEQICRNQQAQMRFS